VINGRLLSSLSLNPKCDQRQAAFESRLVQAAARLGDAQRVWESKVKEGEEEGVRKGREEGLAEGRREGREEGLAEGRREGREEGRKLALALSEAQNLVTDAGSRQSECQAKLEAAELELEQARLRLEEEKERLRASLVDLGDARMGMAALQGKLERAEKTEAELTKELERARLGAAQHSDADLHGEFRARLGEMEKRLLESEKRLLEREEALERALGEEKRLLGVEKAQAVQLASLGEDAHRVGRFLSDAVGQRDALLESSRSLARALSDMSAVVRSPH
jgi:hypothetical protein